MLARRFPLLWTFAGGCLSGAALIGFWPRETETIPSPTKQRVARAREAVSPPIATTTAVRERAIPDDAPDARTEPGSSVADVLARLEAAYREGLAAAAPAHTPPSAGRATTTPTEAQPALVPAPAETAVALAAPAPPPTNAPQADAQPAAAPEADRAMALASRDDAEPRNVNVHIGDTNQSTHVGDVVQGNVILVQQPPVFGYPQLYAAVPYSRGAYPVSPAYPAYPTRGAMSRSATTFESAWTVPNARLGYDSALIPMLK